MNMGALEKFLAKARGLGKMPIEDAVKGAGRGIASQVSKTGAAIKANPRAAVGGGLAGLLAGYESAPDEDDVLKRWLAKRHAEMQGGEE